MRIQFLPAISVAISLLVTVPAVASYEDGLRAYKADQVSAARELWEQAAEAGDKRAQFELGRLYERGKGRILRRDFASAIKWYNAAAEQAYPEAFYALGSMSENGDGMRQDYLQALRYYNLAVRHAGLPKAYFAVGQMYFHGRGVPQDYLKAIESYISAARGGYAPAQYVYGALLEQGWGVKQDLISSYIWYGLAAREDPKILEAVSMNFDARAALETVRRKLNNHDLRKAEEQLRAIIKDQKKSQNPPE
tara:strand:+ start:12886 stop:13635 length:750 start_codon:yes stop_codon:yes gene_type:complete